MTLPRAVLALHAGAGLLLLANAAWLRRQKRRRRPLAPAPRLSVVVPARDEAANLRRLLPSLLAQRYPDFEIVVYDDASEDGTGEVVRGFADPRLRGLRGEGPPPGWLGKTHALYAATRDLSGEVILFLDADAELADDGALRRLAERFRALPAGSVLSGLTHQRGGARLLVSLVPFTILYALPLPLVARLPQPSLSALNGQCWMIARDLYRRIEPHRHCRAEVLEDVQIGRHLKAQGVTPYLLDLQEEVSVYMYRSYGDAWRGFRKNAYLLMGGRPAGFSALFLVFAGALTAAPFLSPRLAASAFALKLASDRFSRFPLWVSALAPVSFGLATLLQLDSALHHWRGRVSWKGRRVG